MSKKALTEEELRYLWRPPSIIEEMPLSGEEFLRSLRKAQACSRSLEWLQERERTLEEAIHEYPHWVLWAIDNGVIPDEFREYVKEIANSAALYCPNVALFFRGAVEYLATEIVDICARYMPNIAIECAADKLSQEVFDRCIEHCPRSALRFAAEKLTPKQLDWCAEQLPRTALIYVAELLTPARLDWCAEQNPDAAFLYAADKLTPERRAWCAEQYPRIVRESSK